MTVILEIIITALALWAVTALVPGVNIINPSDSALIGDGQYDKILLFLGVTVIFLLVNAVVKPILSLIGLPITILTLGLFLFVINAAVFALTGWLSSQLGLGMEIDGFWPALFGSAVLAFVRSVLGMLTGGLRQN